MHHTWLRSFHAVAHEGGFTKGAQYLGVGQPTVTAQVRSLEEAFDVELFLRIGKTTKLTEAGETLFGITRTWFGCQQGAIDLLRNGGGRSAYRSCGSVQRTRMRSCRWSNGSRTAFPKVKFFPHHRTARGNSTPADRLRNRRGRHWPPANGPAV